MWIMLCSLDSVNFLKDSKTSLPRQYMIHIGEILKGIWLLVWVHSMGILNDRRHQWAWLCSCCVWCRSELWVVNWKVQVLLEDIGSISCDQFSNTWRWLQQGQPLHALWPVYIVSLSFALETSKPKAPWSILIQASLYCNKESTGFRNCRSHWNPDWNLVWYPVKCSAIQCMSLRVPYCHRLRDACLQGIQDGAKNCFLFIKAFNLLLGEKRRNPFFGNILK